MGRQYSTALSDLVLAYSALHAACSVISTNLYAFTGFMLICTAASLGVFRFASSKPSSQLLTWHKYMSWLSSVLGVSLIAIAYFRQFNLPTPANALASLAITLCILKPHLSEKVLSTASEIVSAIAILTIVLLNIFQLNALAVIGAGMYVVSGLVIGTEGEWHGIAKVDLFHYALVVGNIGLMMGLNVDPIPVYYNGG